LVHPLKGVVESSSACWWRKAPTTKNEETEERRGKKTQDTAITYLSANYYYNYNTITVTYLSIEAAALKTVAFLKNIRIK
jgi:hypothetical protein